METFYKTRQNQKQVATPTLGKYMFGYYNLFSIWMTALSTSLVGLCQLLQLVCTFFLITIYLIKLLFKLSQHRKSERTHKHNQNVLSKSKSKTAKNHTIQCQSVKSTN